MTSMRIPNRLLPALGSLVLGTTTALAADLDVGLGYYHNGPAISQPAFGPMPRDAMGLGSDGIPGLSFKYFPTPAISLETFLTPRFKFAVRGDGALASAGTVGSVKVLQPTVLAHWHPLQGRRRLDPYVGAGLTYLHLSQPRLNAAGTALLGSADAIQVDDALAPIVHFGTAVQLRTDLSVSVSAAYLWTKSDVTLEAASPTGPMSFDTEARIRAWIIGVALQKRFHFED